MPKFIAVVPFLVSGSHREVEAANKWEAMVKAVQEAHAAGRWDASKYPPPSGLCLMEGNEHEDTLHSASYEVARRPWAEYHAMDEQGVGDDRQRTWMKENYLGVLCAFGPIA